MPGARGKPTEAALLGPVGEPLHTRQILNQQLPKLCQAAGVPRVCPHSLRGLNATLALQAGATAQQVATALGHAHFSTTARHYADGSAVRNAQLRRVADLLSSDKGSSLEPLADLLRDSLTAADLHALGRLLGLVPVGGSR